MDKAIPFSVVSGGGRAGQSSVDSPSAPPLIDLTREERKVWDYICQSLRGAGVEHLTAGMPIAVIVRTYTDWLAAWNDCAEKGRTQQAQNGWHSEAPWAADEKRLKMELSQWLPKACLTIPSLARTKKDMGIGNGQDDLFADMLSHAQSRPGVAA